MLKTRILAVYALAVMLLLPAYASPQQCMVATSDEYNTIRTSVGTCSNMGCFSTGGIYNGEFERLTYNYPSPWKGTFVTVSVDGSRYTTSENPSDSELMDKYIVKRPHLFSDDTIYARWALPNGIEFSQELVHEENRSILRFDVRNMDKKTHEVGLRLHLDTMLGENDGAPIYVPGKGLQTNEMSFAGGEINFGYWKAYNKPWDPTIVATGFINPKEDYTLPDRVTIANWKRSKDTSWHYPVNRSVTVLGDSALLLYFDVGRLAPEQGKIVVTGYGSARPVLPQEKGEWGITEVLVDDSYGRYCPGDSMTLSVDTLSSRLDEEGFINARLYTLNGTVFEGSELAVFKAGRIVTTRFNFTIPKGMGDERFTAEAALMDNRDNVVDRVVKTHIAFIDSESCIPFEPEKTGFPAIMLIPLIFLLVLLVLVILAILWFIRGKIVFEKLVEPGDVRVVVSNETRKVMQGVKLTEYIPRGAEIHVETIGVTRYQDRLEWSIDSLKPGEDATLEYAISGREPESAARLVWDGGVRKLE